MVSEQGLPSTQPYYSYDSSSSSSSKRSMQWAEGTRRMSRTQFEAIQELKQRRAKASAYHTVDEAEHANSIQQRRRHYQSAVSPTSYLAEHAAKDVVDELKSRGYDPDTGVFVSESRSDDCGDDHSDRYQSMQNMLDARDNTLSPIGEASREDSQSQRPIEPHSYSHSQVQPRSERRFLVSSPRETSRTNQNESNSPVSRMDMTGTVTTVNEEKADADAELTQYSTYSSNSSATGTYASTQRSPSAYSVARSQPTAYTSTAGSWDQQQNLSGSSQSSGALHPNDDWAESDQTTTTGTHGSVSMSFHDNHASHASQASSPQTETREGTVMDGSIGTKQDDIQHLPRGSSGSKHGSAATCRTKSRNSKTCNETVESTEYSAESLPRPTSIMHARPSSVAGSASTVSELPFGFDSFSENGESRTSSRSSVARSNAEKMKGEASQTESRTTVSGNHSSNRSARSRRSSGTRSKIPALPSTMSPSSSQGNRSRQSHPQSPRMTSAELPPIHHGNCKDPRSGTYQFSHSVGAKSAQSRRSSSSSSSRRQKLMLEKSPSDISGMTQDHFAVQRSDDELLVASAAASSSNESRQSKSRSSPTISSSSSSIPSRQESRCESPFHKSISSTLCELDSQSKSRSAVSSTMSPIHQNAKETSMPPSRRREHLLGRQRPNTGQHSSNDIPSVGLVARSMLRGEELDAPLVSRAELFGRGDDKDTQNASTPPNKTNTKTKRKFRFFPAKKQQSKGKKSSPQAVQGASVALPKTKKLPSFSFGRKQERQRQRQEVDPEQNHQRSVEHHVVNSQSENVEVSIPRELATSEPNIRFESVDTRQSMASTNVEEEYGKQTDAATRGTATTSSSIRMPNTTPTHVQSPNHATQREPFQSRTTRVMSQTSPVGLRCFGRKNKYQMTEAERRQTISRPEPIKSSKYIEFAPKSVDGTLSTHDGTGSLASSHESVRRSHVNPLTVAESTTRSVEPPQSSGRKNYVRQIIRSISPQRRRLPLASPRDKRAHDENSVSNTDNRGRSSSKVDSSSREKRREAFVVKQHAKQPSKGKKMLPSASPGKHLIKKTSFTSSVATPKNEVIVDGKKNAVGQQFFEEGEIEIYHSEKDKSKTIIAVNQKKVKSSTADDDEDDDISEAREHSASAPQAQSLSLVKDRPKTSQNDEKPDHENAETNQSELVPRPSSQIDKTTASRQLAQQTKHASQQSLIVNNKNSNTTSPSPLHAKQADQNRSSRVITKLPRPKNTRTPLNLESKISIDVLAGSFAQDSLPALGSNASENAEQTQLPDSGGSRQSLQAPRYSQESESENVETQETHPDSAMNSILTGRAMEADANAESDGTSLQQTAALVVKSQRSAPPLRPVLRKVAVGETVNSATPTKQRITGVKTKSPFRSAMNAVSGLTNSQKRTVSSSASSAANPRQAGRAASYGKGGTMASTLQSQSRQKKEQVLALNDSASDKRSQSTTSTDTKPSNSSAQATTGGTIASSQLQPISSTDQVVDEMLKTEYGSAVMAPKLAGVAMSPTSEYNKSTPYCGVGSHYVKKTGMIQAGDDPDKQVRFSEDLVFVREIPAIKQPEENPEDQAVGVDETLSRPSTTPSATTNTAAEQKRKKLFSWLRRDSKRKVELASTPTSHPKEDHQVEDDSESVLSYETESSFRSRSYSYSVESVDDETSTTSGSIEMGKNKSHSPAAPQDSDTMARPGPSTSAAMPTSASMPLPVPPRPNVSSDVKNESDLTQHQRMVMVENRPQLKTLPERLPAMQSIASPMGSIRSDLPVVSPHDNRSAGRTSHGRIAEELAMLRKREKVKTQLNGHVRTGVLQDDRHDPKASLSSTTPIEDVESMEEGIELVVRPTANGRNAIVLAKTKKWSQSQPSPSPNGESNVRGQTSSSSNSSNRFSFANLSQQEGQSVVLPPQQPASSRQEIKADTKKRRRLFGRKLPQKKSSTSRLKAKNTPVPSLHPSSPSPFKQKSKNNFATPRNSLHYDNITSNREHQNNFGMKRPTSAQRPPLPANTTTKRDQSHTYENQDLSIINPVNADIMAGEDLPSPLALEGRTRSQLSDDGRKVSTPQYASAFSNGRKEIFDAPSTVESMGTGMSTRTYSFGSSTMFDDQSLPVRRSQHTTALNTQQQAAEPGWLGWIMEGLFPTTPPSAPPQIEAAPSKPKRLFSLSMDSSLGATTATGDITVNSHRIEDDDWQEILNATDTLARKFNEQRVETGDESDHSISDDTIDEVNEAIGTFRHHAAQLGVNERQLMAAVREDDNNSQAIVRLDSLTTVETLKTNRDMVSRLGGAADDFIDMFEYFFAQKQPKRR